MLSGRMRKKGPSSLPRVCDTGCELQSTTLRFPLPPPSTPRRIAASRAQVPRGFFLFSLPPAPPAAPPQPFLVRILYSSPVVPTSTHSTLYLFHFHTFSLPSTFFQYSSTNLQEFAYFLLFNPVIDFAAIKATLCDLRCVQYSNGILYLKLLFSFLSSILELFNLINQLTAISINLYLTSISDFIQPPHAHKW
jgi:hypothetical protein